MIQQVSDSELELMKIVWANGGTALYAYIMEELAKIGRTWQKNTVITLLSRLVEKGLLKTSKIGRRNEYVAIVSEADYQASQTQTFLDRLYDGNVKGLVSTLIQNEMFTSEDYEELKQFWERGRAVNERYFYDIFFNVGIGFPSDFDSVSFKAFIPKQDQQTVAVLCVANCCCTSAFASYAGRKPCGEPFSVGWSGSGALCFCQYAWWRCSIDATIFRGCLG